MDLDPAAYIEVLEKKLHEQSNTINRFVVIRDSLESMYDELREVLVLKEYQTQQAEGRAEELEKELRTLQQRNHELEMQVDSFHEHRAEEQKAKDQREEEARKAREHRAEEEAREARRSKEEARREEEMRKAEEARKEDARKEDERAKEEAQAQAQVQAQADDSAYGTAERHACNSGTLTPQDMGRYEDGYDVSPLRRSAPSAYGEDSRCHSTPSSPSATVVCEPRDFTHARAVSESLHVFSRTLSPLDAMRSISPADIGSWRATSVTTPTPKSARREWKTLPVRTVNYFPPS